jgi:Cu(I)/Ag(I) efflux system membrane fusion protein
MKQMTLAFAIFSILWFGAGCGELNNPSGEVAAKTSHQEGGFCKEHGMLESECTKCNPSLEGKVLISPERQSLSGIKTEKVKIRSLPREISATGKINYNEKKLTHLTSRVSGRVEEVFAFLYSRVEKGESLVSLYSPEYLAVQSEYIQAEERLKKAKPRNDPEEEVTAGAIFQSTKQKLIILGVSEKEMVRLEETHTIQPHLLIQAPFSGTIVESNVTQGNYVDQQTNLYKLADLSTVWVMADVYEKDIADLKAGQVAQITTPIYPDEIFTGRVESISDVLDEKTRTFEARVVLSNPQRKLKPEMFVNVSIITKNDSSLAIPKSAVLMDGEKNIVFISTDDQTYFRRELQLGNERDGLVQIISGLNPDENVVIEGNFLLKSELLKSEMGAGCAE